MSKYEIKIKNLVPRNVLSDARIQADMEEMLRAVNAPGGEYSILVEHAGQLSGQKKPGRKTWSFQYRKNKADIQFYYRLPEGSRRFVCIMVCPITAYPSHLAATLIGARPLSAKPTTVEEMAKVARVVETHEGAEGASDTERPSTVAKVKLETLRNWTKNKAHVEIFILAFCRLIKMLGVDNLSTTRTRELFLTIFEVPPKTSTKGVGKAIGTLARRGYLSPFGKSSYRVGEGAMEFPPDDGGPRGYEEVLATPETKPRTIEIARPLSWARDEMLTRLNEVEARLTGKIEEVHVLLAKLSQHFRD